MIAMGVFTFGDKLLNWLSYRHAMAKMMETEADDKKYVDYLAECSSRKSTKGLIPDAYEPSLGSSVESIESVLLPLISCVEIVQKRNPDLKDFPDLVSPSVEKLFRPREYKDKDKTEVGLGITLGGKNDAENNATRPKKFDHEIFDVYCKCRQFIEAAGNLLDPEEKEALQSVLDRYEGEGFRNRYALLQLSKMTEERKSASTLILPVDFFDNATYFDPDAPVIGCLSNTILKGGGQRFAMMIDTLASRGFGYIDPKLDNKRLLVSRLTGRTQPSDYSEVHWINKTSRSVSETEKVMLWLTKFMFGGGYDRAYEILDFERKIKPGQETANLKNADKVFRSRIEGLYRKV